MEDREQILNRILSNIPDRYDKSKGLFPYDLSKATAIELERSYEKVNELRKMISVENYSGEDLDIVVYERTGRVRRKATKAAGMVTIKGMPGTDLKANMLVASETNNYRMVYDAKVGENETIDVLVECELAGSIGNVGVGAIKYFPVSIPGLISATNLEPIINGYDAESDESLRERYYEFIEMPPTSGNPSHYIMWAKEVEGVGKADCIPLWNGNGTVKVVIVDYNLDVANDDLVAKVAEYIEEVRPVGATVTVTSARHKDIDITAEVSIAIGYNIQSIQADFARKLEEYRKESVFKDTYVSHAKVGKILLDTDGVLDYKNLKLNGTNANIPLKSKEEIANFKNVQLDVM